jgi:iron(III) transport system substrate-binding protein
MNVSGKRVGAAAAVAAATVAVLAGCSAAAGATGSTSGKEPLVLYAAVGYDSAVAKAFTKKTGIDVKVVDDSTGPLLTKISAEKNNPQWSMLWVDGDTAFSSLDQQGLLSPYTPKAAYTAAGTAVVPADGSYTPTGTTVMAALIYNAAKASAVPTSYDDLLTKAYQGKVGMNDPAQSGPTYPFIAGLMNQLGGTSGGVKAGEAYLTKLKANGLTVFPTNGDTLHALETGQIDYGLIQSSAALGEIAKVKASATFQPKVVYLPKSTLLPTAIAIDKGASATQQAEAKQFIDYVVSPEGQKVMQGADPAGDSLYWPVVDGVSSASGVPAFPADYQRIDPVFWGPLQAQVVSWFDSNIK